jgi:hypothetical protein
VERLTYFVFNSVELRIKMSGELKGEWKLLKIWECRKCKALIRDERRAFEHRCDIKENELTTVNKTIEEQKGTIDSLKTAIEEQKGTIDSLKTAIEDRNISIEKLNETIKNQKEAAENQRKMIIGQNKSIEYHKKTIDSQKSTIDEQNNLIKEKEEEDQTKIIEDQTRIIEGHKRAIESQKRSIDDRDIIINDQKKVIESQKKIIKDQEIEKKAVNKNIPKIGNENNGGIYVHILEQGKPIKDSKDTGYRDDVEIEIFEKGKGKDRIIIKNGRLAKKPEHINIIGEHTSEGFVMKGIYKN